jgi:hypothetical protein
MQQRLELRTWMLNVLGGFTVKGFQVLEAESFRYRRLGLVRCQEKWKRTMQWKGELCNRRQPKGSERHVEGYPQTCLTC